MMNTDSQQFENIAESERHVTLTEIPVRVQRIHIDGVHRTKTDIITQNVKNVFSASNFDEMVRLSFVAKTQMEMLGLFKSALIHIDIHRGESASPDGYEITYVVDEPRRVTGGITTLVGTNEGSLLLSIRMPNAAGRGERISTDFIYGSKNAVGWSVNFIKPLLGNVQLPLSAGVFQNSVEFPWSSYRELNRGLACDFSFPAVYGVNTVRWEGTWRELSSSSRTTAFAVREQSGPGLKSAVRYTWSRDMRDNRVLPNTGYLLKAVNEVAGLVGDANYWKHETEFQAYKQLYWDTVVQMSFAAGLMNPLIHGTKLSIMDQFFLGGPLTLRGFTIKGAGPHEDGCALGANAYWSAAFHVYTPLPFRPGRGFGDLFRTHLFVNAGNLSNIDLGSQWKQGVMSLADTVRWSYGGGLVLRLGGIARIELNYVVPVKVEPTDSVCSGLQFGIGVTFL